MGGYSLVSGGKDGGENEAANAQSRIARQLYAESAPLRQNLLGLYGNMFGGAPNVMPPSGGMMPGVSKNAMIDSTNGKGGAQQGIASAPNFDPTQSFMFEPARNVINQQFENARENIIANTAPGGALLDRLAENETQKAMQLGSLAADIGERDLNRAIGLATGQTQQAQSGFNSAAYLQAQQAQQQAQDKQGAGQALGTMAGMAKLCDRRMKENLRIIGTADNGLNIYIGNYKDSPNTELFVVAQEVQALFPEAVEENDDILYVNLEAIPWRA